MIAVIKQNFNILTLLYFSIMGVTINIKDKDKIPKKVAMKPIVDADNLKLSI